MTAAKLAQYIRSLGYEVGEVFEGDDLEDGAIYVSDNVHVQVGEGYCCVVRSTLDERQEEAFVFGQMLLDTTQLGPHINKALADEEAEAEIYTEAAYNV